MEDYKERVHRVLRCSPAEALSRGVITNGDVHYINRRYKLAEKQPSNVQHLVIGEKVRVVLRKQKLIDKGSAPRFSLSRHTILSDEGGLYYVPGRSEPYRANELLLAGAEDAKDMREKEKQEERELREAEQIASRRDACIDRRIAKEDIDRLEPEVALCRSDRVRKPVHNVVDSRYGLIHS